METYMYKREINIISTLLVILNVAPYTKGSRYGAEDGTKYIIPLVLSLTILVIVTIIVCCLTSKKQYFKKIVEWCSTIGSKNGTITRKTHSKTIQNATSIQMIVLQQKPTDMIEMESGGDIPVEPTCINDNYSCNQSEEHSDTEKLLQDKCKISHSHPPEIFLKGQQRL
ncbi:unnamed protein product [Owenia fusiformis]|uniref:Uncharacterized protein n=1 Tax=Owenia fusiformis TaxID=6347 RepID=A0A8S4MX91_OWEFU|nr:unnamed protein product [Owenia fusiformis]